MPDQSRANESMWACLWIRCHLFLHLSRFLTPSFFSSVSHLLGMRTCVTQHGGAPGVRELTCGLTCTHTENPLNLASRLQHIYLLCAWAFTRFSKDFWEATQTAFIALRSRGEVLSICTEKKRHLWEQRTHYNNHHAIISSTRALTLLTQPLLSPAFISRAYSLVFLCMWLAQIRFLIMQFNTHFLFFSIERCKKSSETDVRCLALWKGPRAGVSQLSLCQNLLRQKLSGRTQIHPHTPASAKLKIDPLGLRSISFFFLASVLSFPFTSLAISLSVGLRDYSWTMEVCKERRNTAKQTVEIIQAKMSE